MWVNTRCLWVNFVRIKNFIAGGISKRIKKVAKGLFLPQLGFKYVKKCFVMRVDINLIRFFPVNGFEVAFFKN